MTSLRLALTLILQNLCQKMTVLVTENRIAEAHLQPEGWRCFKCKPQAHESRKVEAPRLLGSTADDTAKCCIHSNGVIKAFRKPT